MKTSALPALRVAPALRSDADAVLDEGASLSDARRKAARALNDRQRNLIVPFGSSGLIGALEVRGDLLVLRLAKKHPHALDHDFSGPQKFHQSRCHAWAGWVFCWGSSLASWCSAWRTFRVRQERTSSSHWRCRNA